MKKRFWNIEKLVGFVAIFISVLTLIIFVKQTNIMDKQSRLSVLPYLVFESSDNNEDNEFIIEIFNYGVGPAIIESKELFYGKSYGDIEFYDFIVANAAEFDSLNLSSHSSVDKGLAIPAGDSRIIAKIKGAEEYAKFLKVFKKFEENEFNYIINYKSIYDNRWQVDVISSEPIELD